MLSPTVAKTSDFGYVVKIDQDKVYIDITEANAPNLNDKFTVFTEGEQLINPVTKKSLGAIEDKKAQGTITEVTEKYAVGTINSKTAEIIPGQKVKWDKISRPQPLPTMQPAELATAQAPLYPTLTTIWQSAPVDGIVRSIALADVTGNGKNEIICAKKHSVGIYTVEGNKLKIVLEQKLSGSSRVVSVDAGNFGGSKIFVTSFNPLAKEFTTEVLKMQGNKLIQTDSLNMLVRSVKSTDGTKTFYAQKIYQTGGIKKSKISKLVYKKGKFKLVKTVKMPRFDWVYGFNFINVEKTNPDLMYITSSDKIRLQKHKRGNYVDSQDMFGRTPNVVRIDGEVFQMYPRLPLYKNTGGEIFVYAVENIGKRGILARAFGLYEKANLHRLKWTGSNFEATGTLPMPGYSYDITRGKLADLEDGVISASVNLDDKSIISVIQY